MWPRSLFMSKTIRAKSTQIKQQNGLFARELPTPKTTTNVSSTLPSTPECCIKISSEMARAPQILQTSKSGSVNNKNGKTTDVIISNKREFSNFSNSRATIMTRFEMIAGIPGTFWGTSKGNCTSPRPTGIDCRRALLFKQVRACCSCNSSLENASNQIDSTKQVKEVRQGDYYDDSLIGRDSDIDKKVERHKLETMVYNKDRELKDEQAKLVAPEMKQSPVALMTLNPTYRNINKALNVDYHGSVENLRLNNTGYFWDVKIPYQVSMLTSLHGAQFQSTSRYRLDQFHCHWGQDDRKGSEHTVDSLHYSAEMHFVHYNMDKYRTLAQAARHPDGLVVLAVFLEARDGNHNHAELEKIATNLAGIPLKGEHTIIRQGIRIENFLPQNRSFWSYHGSLTTSPYYESVTWFVMKYPIQCSSSQLQRFRSMKSSARNDEDTQILSNLRDIQPLHGRVIYNFDDPSHVHH